MKILVCDKTEADAIERMRAAGLTVDTNFEITPEELPNVLPAYDGMVVRSRTKVRQPLIDVCPNLKVIVRGGVGLDTIDADYARSKGITVMNTPKASSASVAELAIGYMFALARSIYKATATMKAEKWEKKAFEGDEIGGKTLGLIGIGNIGKEVAKRAAALGMTVLAYDPYVKEAEDVKLVSLDELLAQADYISLHLPKTKESPEHDRQGPIREDENRRADHQLRPRRHCQRSGALRSVDQWQGGRGCPGCLCRGAAHGLEAGQTG